MRVRMRLFGVAVLFAMTAGGTAGALGQGSGDPEIVREIHDFVRNVYLTDRLDTVRGTVVCATGEPNGSPVGNPSYVFSPD